MSDKVVKYKGDREVSFIDKDVKEWLDEKLKKQNLSLNMMTKVQSIRQNTLLMEMYWN